MFSVFSTWLPHHMTYDVIIINKTFYMSSHSEGEKFVSIRQAVAEKNTKVLCEQTIKKKSLRATLGKTEQSRTARGRAHTLVRLNSSPFVSH